MSEHKIDIETADINTVCINTVRCLAADMVQKANSGHPGAPMGLAPVAHVLWNKVMKYNPANPHWFNRDRFVLSNGHACALQYAMLHLSGYDLTMHDLMRFRQVDSRTPGHPEVHVTPGVEVTTGPLGQGVANAVGLAIAEAHLAAVYNKPGFEIFNNYTYAVCGDGCMQEGISGESASIAGHLGLGKLIVIYDDNKVTIDGPTDLSFSENVALRYQAYGWHIVVVEDGNNDLQGIERAIEEAKSVTDKPSLVVLKTIIGFGSVHQGEEAVHGSPLGDADIAQVKTKFGFDPAKKFFIPERVQAFYAPTKTRGAEIEQKWNDVFAAYAQQFPKEAAEIKRRFAGELPADWNAHLPKFTPADKADATRNISGVVLNALAKALPELIGGSADLTPSNKTQLKMSGDFEKHSFQHRYLRFGVREHAMAAIGNGLFAYGALIPFTATFLNFIEYAYGAVRLSCLSGVQQIYIMTHDSIGLGEDGPTHQPIEALTLCRATPNMTVWRPADGNETVAAYVSAMQNRHGPAVMALSRQNVPQLQGSSVEHALRGGYVLHDPTEGKERPDLILAGTGTEVSLCVAAAQKLAGKKVRIVSFPSLEVFDKQPAEYRRSVLTPGVPVVSVEALSVVGWDRYAHLAIGMTTFGSSGPYQEVYAKFGLTPDAVAARVTAFLEAHHREAEAAGLSTNFALLRTHFA